MPGTLAAGAVASIIPVASLRASVGFTLDTTHRAWVCPRVGLCASASAGKTQIGAALAAQAGCALQHLYLNRAGGKWNYRYNH
jgi:hypothetical protein